MDPLRLAELPRRRLERLRLATGICLVLEHDLLDLACTVATLDVLSGGRVLLGIGVGWNEEELANHRPDVPFAQRYSAMRERVAALRADLDRGRAELRGQLRAFTPSWVYPKPPQAAGPRSRWATPARRHPPRRGVRRRLVPDRRLSCSTTTAARTWPAASSCSATGRGQRPRPGRHPDHDVRLRRHPPGPHRDVRRPRRRAHRDPAPPTMQPHDADATLRHLDDAAALVELAG